MTTRRFWDGVVVHARWAAWNVVAPVLLPHFLRLPFFLPPTASSFSSTTVVSFGENPQGGGGSRTGRSDGANLKGGAARVSQGAGARLGCDRESTWSPSAAASAAGGGGHGGLRELAVCPVLPHDNVTAGKKRGKQRSNWWGPRDGDRGEGGWW
jgi:hypothetical protein